MGFYSNLPTGEGLRNMQNAIANLAQIQTDTQKNLRESLNGVGNAIKDYAQFRLVKEKTQRDEAFRQKEFDEKNRQFNVNQDNQMEQFNATLAQQAKQWDEGAQLRKAQANQAFASAFNTSEDAKAKREVRLERDKAEKEHQAKLKAQAEQKAKNEAIANELQNDGAKKRANTPMSKVKKGLALLGGVFGAPAQRIESLY